jgi:glycosyltransferase involved in cell wall biosynthesis
MKVALVVQRYGRDVVGGSETLARHYARVFSQFADVEVLTTCAVDHITWRNRYPAGVASEDGIVVRRFPVDVERGPYFWKLNMLFQGAVDMLRFSRSPAFKQDHVRRLENWPTALQQEYIRAQGPYSSELFDHLERSRNDYDVACFLTYCYVTTLEGMKRFDRRRTVLIPTLHDEPMAYLPICREALARPALTVFLSEAERRLAERLRERRGRSLVVGMAITPPASIPPPPAGTPAHYLLYAGRIESAKGCSELFDAFALYKQARPSDLKLVLVGRMVLPPPRHPDIVYLGFVGEAEKFALLRGAKALVNPSAFESFSIVLMESLSVGTPVLVNRHCAVTAEHARLSGAGLAYGAPAEWCVAVDRLLSLSAAERQRWSDRGRAYVAARYSHAVVARKLELVLREFGRPRSPSVPGAAAAAPRLVSWSVPCLQPRCGIASGGADAAG